MVESQSARPSRTGAVLALCILLATPLLALLGPAAAQDVGSWTLVVPQGKVVIVQAGTNTSFLDNRTIATVRATVENHGPNGVADVPVYFWFNDTTTNPGLTRLSGKCKLYSFDAAQPNPNSNPVNGNQLVPSVRTVEWEFNVPVSSPPGGYNISVRVNERPPSIIPDSQLRNVFGDDCDYSAPSGKHGLTGQVDPAGGEHTAEGYFVKDQKLDLKISATEHGGIRWCRGEPTVDGPCRTDMSTSRYPYVYNRTVHYLMPDPEDPDEFVRNTNEQLTYLQVNVTTAGTWREDVDWGGPCRCADDGFAYRVGVTASGFNLTGSKDITWADQKPRGDGWQTVAVLDLKGLAKGYLINVTLDPPAPGKANGNLTEASPTASVNAEANNKANRTVEVGWNDFEVKVNATDFRTSAATAYEYTTEFTIRGNISFRNLGPRELLPILHPEGQRDPDGNGPLGQRPNAKLVYTVYLKDAGDRFRITKTIDHTGDLNFVYDRIDTVTWQATSTPGVPGYIRPGMHKLVAEIDVGDHTLEPNESNNRVELDIYIEDGREPTILQGPNLNPVADATVNITGIRPAEPFYVRAHVEDDDLAGTKVKANFSLQGNASVYRTFNLTPVDGTPTRFEALLSNFTFHGNGSVQNWTARIEVKDAFNNSKNSTQKVLRIDRWPIHTVPDEWLLRPGQVDDGQRFNYSDNEPISYVLRTFQNWTGVANQANVTHNLFMWVEPAGSNRLNHTGGWQSLTGCQPVLNATEIPEGLPQGDNVCNPTDDLFSNFQNTVHRASGKPGRWNVSIGIMDASGAIRWINRTILLADLAPVPVSMAVRNASFGPVDSADATERIWITANFSDDRAEQMTAYANFTRTDGAYANFTLTPRPAFMAPNPEGVLVPHFRFNDTITTGIGGDLGMAGKFNVTVSAQDGTGNWNSAPVMRFTINDSQDPRVHEARAFPSVQEVNQNVTFSARGWDETNMTMRVSVFSGGSEVMPAVTVKSEDGGNFTWTTNFSVEGNYAWIIALIDSEGRATERAGTLSIRDNLGPRFEVISPSAVVGSELYGQALQRIEVLAYDSDTVDLGSVVMTVDGQPVVPDPGPAPAGVSGVTLVYQVPSSRRFAHGDVVEVNLTATDGSSKRLEGWLNFTFKVDAVAPSARFVSFEPRHREGAGVWNVSLATRFTLAGDDNDGLPTGVETLRYLVRAGGANSGETVYNGPFRIADAPGVYRGPTLYSVEIWAEDEVGNVNSTRVPLQVWVDDAPPDLVQFFPQGRYVNATLVDERTGVSRATVWHRVNAEPYKPLPLEDAGNNVWKAVLPEAVKGDHVSYYLQAWDNLNNTQTFGNASEPKVSFPASNHRPLVRVTSPVPSSRVIGTFDLLWNASDEDGDALTFIVSYRPPGRTGYVELAKLDNSDARRYPVDSRRFQDGEYVFRVQANDGGVVEEAIVTLRIVNRADAIIGVSPITGEVTAGSTVLLKAEIAKAEAIVEARLYRNGEKVGTYAMNDEGRDGDEVANDGVYSVHAPVEASGDYAVEIFTRYEEDGEVRSSSMRDAVTFSAKLTPEYVLKEYGILLVLIALVAAVAIGLGAWTLARKKE